MKKDCTKSVGWKAAQEKSRKTHNRRGENNKALYDQSPKKCRGCESFITYEKRNNQFCSQSCGASYNNRAFPKRVRICACLTIPAHINDCEKYSNCKQCSKEFKIRTQSTCTNEYCSAQCQSDYKFLNITLPAFERGEAGKATKTCLILKCGENCVWCGIGNVYNSKPIVLQMDHIDGNSDNNEPENLRLLCPNCHSQTPTYGSKNRGNDSSRKIERNRINRRKRLISTSGEV